MFQTLKNYHLHHNQLVWLMKQSHCYSNCNHILIDFLLYYQKYIYWSFKYNSLEIAYRSYLITFTTGMTPNINMPTPFTFIEQCAATSWLTCLWFRFANSFTRIIRAYWFITNLTRHALLGEEKVHTLIVFFAFLITFGHSKTWYGVTNHTLSSTCSFFTHQVVVEFNISIKAFVSKRS